MIQHFFKIAFRNILKYRTQSIISIIGLAVGFTCFALANLWIHYEDVYKRQSLGTLLWQVNKAARINPAKIMKSE